MCYEFSEWSWKVRAGELARKQRDAEKTLKKASKADEAATPPTPEPKVEEQEKVPA